VPGHSQFSGCRNEFWQSFYAGCRSFSSFSCVRPDLNGHIISTCSA
jgi:hypothetical protein